MQLYNSLSRRLEPFSPREDLVTIYVCGITPYDTTHLGHAFTYATADVLIRYLEYKGFRVRYVQNVTDIDDDILRRAAQVGEDWRRLGDRWTAHFIEDMRTLNVRPPDVFPRATDVIDEIHDAVQALLDAGVAYAGGGSVYFAVDSWDEYGKLSHLDREAMLPVANERGNHPDDPNKRNPLDFVLWQAQAPGEPGWDSPWGPGRPGWHIECSTMASRYLGPTIDIHGGGADLIFPHHESEIAQMEPVTGERPFVRTWMHTAMVHHQGEKMSKSLGNLLMVRDLLSTCSPDALRLYLASHHYRQEWAFDRAELERGAERVERVRAALQVAGGDGARLDPGSQVQAFEVAMDRDLESGPAVGALINLADLILTGAVQGAAVGQARAALRAMARVFGLRVDSAEAEGRVVAGWNAHLRRFAEEPV